jgi:hypothetical protein
LNGNKEKARSINAWLDTLTGRMYECRQQLYSAGKPFTATHVRKLMQGEELNPVKKLSDIFTYQIDFIDSLVGHSYTISTLRKYKKTYETLRSYMKKNYQVDDMRLVELDFKFIRNTKPTCAQTLNYKIIRSPRPCAGSKPLPAWP